MDNADIISKLQKELKYYEKKLSSLDSALFRSERRRSNYTERWQKERDVYTNLIEQTLARIRELGSSVE